MDPRFAKDIGEDVQENLWLINRQITNTNPCTLKELVAVLKFDQFVMSELNFVKTLTYFAVLKIQEPFVKA